jgi:hypothetical protein
VVPVAALNVPLPVLVFATEKVRDCEGTAVLLASVAVIVIGMAVPVTAVVVVVFSVSVEPTI